MNGCRKCLKDRSERRLELDDIRTYCRIVTALKRTIGIQEEIDALYLEIDKHPLPCPVSLRHRLERMSIPQPLNIGF